MGYRLLFFLSTIFSAAGCLIVVTAMLSPSWFAGCKNLGKVLNQSLTETSQHVEASNSSIFAEDAPVSTTQEVIVDSHAQSDIITENASSFADDLICVQQSLFDLHVHFADHTTSLRLIVSSDPTLTIVASIGLIVSIICSAFAVFALITAAAAAKVEVQEEAQRARRNCAVGITLLIIAGTLSAGGMCSYTAGSRDRPFELFTVRFGQMLQDLFLTQEPEKRIHLSNNDRKFVTVLLGELSDTVSYTYSFYLGWVGSASLSISAAFSVVARRLLLSKSATYTNLNVVHI